MSEDHTSEMIGGSASTELASNRTGLAFERTMMGADRLMAIVRTALAMIGFGFTITQIFRQLAAKHLLADAERMGGCASAWACSPSASCCWSWGSPATFSFSTI